MLQERMIQDEVQLVQNMNIDDKTTHDEWIMTDIY